MFSPPLMIMSLLAVGEVQKAFRIQVSDIAGAKPVAPEARPGLGLIAPIAARDLGAAQADLALGARRQWPAIVAHDGQLDMGQGASGGADFLDLAPGLHHGVARAGFGQAIGVDVAGTPENAGELADALLRRALAAADDPLQAVEHMRRPGRAGQAAVEHDRRHPGPGDALACYQGQGQLGIEVALQHQRAARQPQRHPGQVVGAHMVEGPTTSNRSSRPMPSAVMWSRHFQAMLP